MTIKTLVVEASQKCNINCSHCLRGPARNKKLNLEKFDAFLKNVDYIGELTIGGGEPSLALDILDKLKYLLQYSRTSIGNIYIVTNGLHKTKALAKWWLDMYYNVCDDNEISSFGFSFDKWHDWAVYERKNDLRKYHYFEIQDLFMMRGLEDKVCKHTDERLSDGNIIQMGRATSNYYRKLKPEMYIIDEEYNEIQDNTVYFNVEGELYSSCDLSYKEMTPNSKFYVGNYLDNMMEIFTAYNKKLELCQRKEIN